MRLTLLDNLGAVSSYVHLHPSTAAAYVECGGVGACTGGGPGPAVSSCACGAVAPNSTLASVLTGRTPVRGEMEGNIATVREQYSRHWAEKAYRTIYRTKYKGK